MFWNWKASNFRTLLRNDSEIVNFEDEEAEEEAEPMLPIPAKTTPSCPASVDRYLAQCEKYKTDPNPGVIVSLRFQLPLLRPTKPFHCKDMVPLAEVLIAGEASHVVTGDFDLSRLRSHGAIVLAQALPCTRWQTLNLRHNPIGGYGAAALAAAVGTSTTLTHVGLRSCSVGVMGAEAFAALVVEKKTSSVTSLDLSVNSTGLRGTLCMKAALALTDGKIKVDMDNNIVLAEVLNSVTHGLGIILTLLMAGPLLDRAEKGQWAHAWSCRVYVASLLALYTASTLFHSFYFTQRTKRILHLLDQSAIYILIAGTYTPILTIALHHKPVHSTYLLSLLWIVTFFGIAMTTTYTGQYKGRISLTLYLLMGWTALFCIRDLSQAVSFDALSWLFAGGVLYTAGVPFFVMDKDPTTSMFHVVWHLFVMAASAAHFWMIFEFVVPMQISAPKP